MQRRREFLAGVTAAALTATAGCTTVGETESRTATLNLAYDAAPPHFQAVVMQQREQLASIPARVNAEEASCKSIVQLLVSGKADLGMVGMIPALVAIDSDESMQAITASSKDAFVVMATETVADRYDERGGDAIAAFAEEAGRPFELGTYPKGSVSDITARYWIQETDGITAEDVDLVHLGGPNAAQQALVADEVDGALIPEPTPTVIEASDAPYRRIDWVGEFLPGEPAGVTVVRDEFARDHPDVVDAFVEEHVAATEFIHGNAGRAAEYMTSTYGGESALDEQIARKAIERPATEYVSDPRAVVEGTAVLARYAGQLGKTDTTIDTDRIFETDHYDRVVD
ncbi:MAG: ABC transporter substrate-binding protein [Halobacteriota archaeon]